MLEIIPLVATLSTSSVPYMELYSKTNLSSLFLYQAIHFYVSQVLHCIYLMQKQFN